MKEFSTAAKQAVNGDEDSTLLTFKVDDLEVTAYPPTPGQLGVMFSALSERNQEGTRIAGIIDFFFGMLDDKSQAELERRLMDRDDPFEVDQLQEIMMWMVEEWSARPTLRSSDSSESPPSTGPRSTARSRRPASTRSATPSIASAT